MKNVGDCTSMHLSLSSCQRMKVRSSPILGPYQDSPRISCGAFHQLSRHWKGVLLDPRHIVAQICILDPSGMKIMHGVFVSGSNSVMLAHINFMIVCGNSITAICILKQMPRCETLLHMCILQPEFSLRLLYLQKLMAPAQHLHPSEIPMLFHRFQEYANTTVLQVSVKPSP